MNSPGPPCPGFPAAPPNGPRGHLLLLERQLLQAKVPLHQEEVIKAAVEVHGAGGPHSRQVQGTPSSSRNSRSAAWRLVSPASTPPGGRHIPCLRPDGLFPRPLLDQQAAPGYRTRRYGPPPGILPPPWGRNAPPSGPEGARFSSYKSTISIAKCLPAARCGLVFHSLS